MKPTPKLIQLKHALLQLLGHKPSVAGLWAHHDDCKDINAYVRRLRQPREFKKPA